MPNRLNKLWKVARDYIWRNFELRNEADTASRSKPSDAIYCTIHVVDKSALVSALYNVHGALLVVVLLLNYSGFR
jgi:hypothetical protein